MAYDCYFASVMQAEFLEQGTSFHLVSHRESIYGCRRPTSSLVITPRLTFIASGCGVRGEGLGFRNFSSRFNLQNQINLLVPCRTGAIWSLEKRGIRFGQTNYFPLISSRWNKPSYVDYLEKCPKHPGRRCSLKFSFKEAVSLESSSFFCNYYLYLSAVEVNVSDSVTFKWQNHSFQFLIKKMCPWCYICIYIRKQR